MPGGKGHEDVGGDVNGEFSSGGTAKLRELFMEWLLKSYGRAPAFAKHVRTRDLPSRETTTPRDQSGIRALIVFLGRNNTKRLMSS